jgi:hypothetical protein
MMAKNLFNGISFHRGEARHLNTRKNGCLKVAISADSSQQSKKAFSDIGQHSLPSWLGNKLEFLTRSQG